MMIRLALVTLLATPALGQETVALADLLSATHIHGIAAGPDGPDSVTLATHHGLWTADLAASTATRIGASQDDFMGYSPVPDTKGHAFASGHPATGGNIGVIATADGGATWAHVSDGLDGPVDFHNMEVSRADPAVLYGIGHDGIVQHSADSGQNWQATGQAPDKLIDIATSATDPATLYAATETGLFVSRNQGGAWTVLIAQGAPVTTVDTGADGVLRAVGPGLGLVTIGADSAPEIVSANLPDGYLLSLASTSTAPHRLMALSAKGRLVLSDDGGATWADALAR